MVTIDAPNVEAFLDLLTPHRGGALWDCQVNHRNWIFRGQRSAAWGLTPSAHRDGDPWFDAELGGAQLQSVPVPDGDRREREAASVMDFTARAATPGYEIPWDSERLRGVDLAPPSTSDVDFPSPHLRGIFGLAQHYGIPTRLLDWSLRPLVSAYFAAIGASKHIKKTEDASGRLAVWASNMRFLLSCRR